MARKDSEHLCFALEENKKWIKATSAKGRPLVQRLHAEKDGYDSTI